MYRLSLLAILIFISANASAQIPASQKVIKDPAEYNAYFTALNLPDPAQKAAAMENFVTQYPNSIVKVDAIEQAMAAYQQLGNINKVAEFANRILQIDPAHVRALAIAVAIKRNQATANGDLNAATEVGRDAERGLQALRAWSKPDGISDDEFARLKNQMTEIFNGAAGFAALQKKDYRRARDYYLKSVAVNPDNLQDVYQLSIADLQMNPIDVDGFWFIAKAINIAQSQNNAAAVLSIEPYGKAKYKQYHGTDDDWGNLLAAIANQTSLPADFASSIKRAPTPAEIAVQAVEQNDPTGLSFSDKEFILSYRDASPANKQAADKVWQSIQAMQKNGAAKLKIPVKVISATSTTIEAAVSEDNQQTGVADLQVTMTQPMKNVPSPGAQIDIVGVITDYQPRPFKFIMKQGELP